MTGCGWTGADGPAGATGQHEIQIPANATCAVCVLAVGEEDTIAVVAIDLLKVSIDSCSDGMARLTV